MSTGKKFLRWLIIVIAVLVMIASVAGIFGTWWLRNYATDATNQVFSTIDTAVGVVNAGAGRTNALVQQGRAEVQQVESTITAVGANIEENSPLLTAMSDRINQRLEPTVNQIRSVLTPVVSTLQAVRALVDFVNALPFVRETPPAVEKLETLLDQLDQTAADVRQIGDTIRITVVESKNELTDQAVNALTTITTRVDNRLAETEATVTQAQAELVALQQRLAATRSQLLMIYNLAAVVLTLLLFWIVYSQVVVIRHQRMLLRGAGPAAVEAPPPAATIAAPDTAPMVEPTPPPTIPESVTEASAADLPREE